MIVTGFHMSQMDENQIDLDREDYFFRYLKIGLKIIPSKILPHIGMAVEKQTDSFVEVASHLF